MALVLVDRLDGTKAAIIQAPGPTDDSKGAIPHNVQVPEAELDRPVLLVKGLHLNVLLPALLD